MWELAVACFLLPPIPDHWRAPLLALVRPPNLKTEPVPIEIMGVLFNIFPIEIMGELRQFCCCISLIKVLLSVCIHSHVAMVIVFVFVHHGLIFQHWFYIVNSSAHCCTIMCICWTIHNHHIVYGYGFGLQVGWPCRCQKRSSSVAWNWRQKKTCHSKLSHLLDPKCTPLN